MTNDSSIERLLRWRLAHAESDAPAAPRAVNLLRLARPWWEVWPEQLRSRMERLGRMPAAYGFAMEVPQRGRRGYPVPALIAGADDVEAYAWVLFLDARDGHLRFRFQLDLPPGQSLESIEALEATLVSETPGDPLVSGHATLAQNGEHRVDVELPEVLMRSWGALKVTDQMPFRLILRRSTGRP